MSDQNKDPQTEKQTQEESSSKSNNSTIENSTKTADSSNPFEKKETLSMDQLLLENQKLTDNMLRIAADFENYRKRVTRDIEDTRFQTKEKLLREFLPVLDNLDRALTASEGKSEGTQAALLEGVKLVQRQFLQALEKSDVRPFEAQGKMFDPQLHEAVQQVESAELPPGTIVAVLQRGYTSGSKLLRPALVTVAKEKR